MRESTIEKHLVKRCKELGGKAFKFVSPGNNGVPDRLVMLPGRMYLVELKKPGGKLRPEQVVFHKLALRLGISCYVIDSKEGVDRLVGPGQTDQSWKTWKNAVGL